MSVRPGRGAAPQDTVRDRVYSLPKRFRRESVNGLVAQWELRVGSQTFAISVTDHACMVADGPSPAPETIVTTEPETWLAIDEGRITGGQAFLEKRLVLQGNLDLAVRMQTLFRPYRRARHLSDLDQVEVEADGLRISTYLQGNGDPLLLLHGLGGTKITWFPLLPELAERHRLIVPDLPGHGESEKPREDYTPRFYARVLRHLMDEVGVDKAAVIGNSLGGRITLELALRSPSRVSSLILLDPSVPGLRWRYVFGFTRVFPTELGAVPFMVRERWMRAIIRRLFAHPEVLSDEAFAAGASEFIRIYRDPAARMAFFSSLRHILTEPPEQFFGTLRRIKQPTLVLFGDDDRLVPPRLGVRLAQHLPNSTFMVLPGVGHVPQFEATRETLDAIDGFLASQAPPRRRRSTAP